MYVSKWTCIECSNWYWCVWKYLSVKKKASYYSSKTLGSFYSNVATHIVMIFLPFLNFQGPSSPKERHRPCLCHEDSPQVRHGWERSGWFLSSYLSLFLFYINVSLYLSFLNQRYFYFKDKARLGVISGNTNFILTPFCSCPDIFFGVYFDCCCCLF